MRSSSSAASHFDTTTVATPLPIRLVSARASDMNRSTPSMSAMLATGIEPTVARVRGEHDEAGAGHPGGTLRGQQKDADDAELLPQGQLGVGRLRQEDRRHRQVDAGAVEVERVAGRNDQADHR